MRATHRTHVQVNVYQLLIHIQVTGNKDLMD